MTTSRRVGSGQSAAATLFLKSATPAALLADELLQFGDAGKFLGTLLLGLEDDRQAFDECTSPQGEEVGAELMLAAQLGAGLPSGEHLEDDLRFEPGCERASCASCHDCETPSGACTS